jgi:hypothetical protein
MENSSYEVSDSKDVLDWSDEMVPTTLFQTQKGLVKIVDHAAQLSRIVLLLLIVVSE